MRSVSFKSNGLVQKDHECRRPVAFLFNGQGSQYCQMARSLYQQHEAFRQTMQYLDRHVKKHIGESMLSVLYDDLRGKGDPFTAVRFTHPAIFCLQYALADLLQQAGWVPDYLVGSSLGEFVAATISGAIEPEVALEAVLEQAIIIERSCPPGGMLAILSSQEFYSEHPEIFGECELVGINYADHFVIAGDVSVLERAQAMLREHGVSCLSLPVNYGFHSRLIDQAARSYLDYLRRLPVKQPAISVISCQTGAELNSYSQDHFWRATREPIKFLATLQWLEDQVGEGRGFIYIDFGPGGTLANFIKRGLAVQSASSFHSIVTPFDQEVVKLREVEQALLRNLTRG